MEDGGETTEGLGQDRWRRKAHRARSLRLHGTAIQYCRSRLGKLNVFCPPPATSAAPLALVASPVASSPPAPPTCRASDTQLQAWASLIQRQADIAAVICSGVTPCTVCLHGVSACLFLPRLVVRHRMPISLQHARVRAHTQTHTHTHTHAHTHTHMQTLRLGLVLPRLDVGRGLPREA